MVLVELVTALATLELLVFSFLVGRARHQHGFPAPATVGNEIVERYIRAHMNTLEIFAVFIPFLWLGTRYWDPRLIAAIGLVFVIGRILYFRGYVDPAKSRYLGFMLSLVPTTLLLLLSFVGIFRALLA